MGLINDRAGEGARSSAGATAHRRGRRKLGRTAALVGVAFLLSSCFWPAPGAGPDRRSHNASEDRITPESVADLAVIWEAPTPGSARYPATSNSAIHVSVGHRMFGFDQKTGSQLWVHEDPDLPDWAQMGPPIFAGDVVWAGYGIANFNGMYVTDWLDPATGEVLDTPANGIVDGVRGDRYLLSEVGLIPEGPASLTVTVGDLGDPEAGWSGIIDWQDIFDAQPWSPLTLDTDHAYQAGHGLLDLEELTQGNGVRGYAIASRPDCPPDFPDFATCPTWLTELDGDSATSPVLASDGTTLYTATDAGTVYAVDTSNGAIEWSAAVGSAVRDEPALAHGSLYVPTAGGQLVVLDAATGSPQWEADTGGGARQPAVAGGLVFTGGTDGVVRAFDAAGCDGATCDAVWSDETGAAITGAPAVSQGKVYIGTSTSLIAYGLPAEG